MDSCLTHQHQCCKFRNRSLTVATPELVGSLPAGLSLHKQIPSHQLLGDKTAFLLAALWQSMSNTYAAMERAVFLYSAVVWGLQASCGIQGINQSCRSSPQHATASTDLRWEQGGMKGQAIQQLGPGYYRFQPCSFLYNISLLSGHIKAFFFLLLQMSLQRYRRAWNQVKMSGNQC